MLKLIFFQLPKNRFIAKKILRSGSLTTKFYGSYNYEILDYFEKTSKVHQSSAFPKIETPKNTALEEQLSAINKDFKIISNSTEEVSRDLIDDLDIKCYSIIDLLQPSDTLNLFNEFFKLIKYKLKYLYFYDKSIPVLVEAVENNLLSNHQTVQVLFFIALKEDHNAHYITRLQPYLPDLNDLPLIEKCIVAKAFTETSVKMNLRQARIIEKVVEEDFKTLIANPNLLEALCEIIIVSEPNEELSLKNLSRAILNFEQPLDFSSTAHLLSLYAKGLIFEPKVIDKLVKDCISIINEDLKENKHSISVKNFDMFLWSISHLGLTILLPEKLLIRKIFETRFNEYRDKKNLSHLINTILCLNMLRCWSMKAIKFCLQERLFLPLINENYPWKIKSRYKLLITQMTLEMKLKVPKVLTRTISKIGYKVSDNVNKVNEVANELVHKGLINSAVIECPIEAITLPGVTLYTAKDIYHVDVLDNVTCLKNTNVPHGLMNLKLRLLSRLRYRQILINGDVFKDNPEEALSIISKKIEKRINFEKSSTICSDKTFEYIH